MRGALDTYQDAADVAVSLGLDKDELEAALTKAVDLLEGSEKHIRNTAKKIAQVQELLTYEMEQQSLSLEKDRKRLAGLIDVVSQVPALPTTTAATGRAKDFDKMWADASTATPYRGFAEAEAKSGPVPVLDDDTQDMLAMLTKSMEDKEPELPTG